MPSWLTLEMLGGLASALVFGAIAFFSAVVAPLVFIKLPAETAGRFIRALFPVYYLVLGAVSLVAAALLARPLPEAALLMGLCALGFVLARQWLMPAINLSRDRMLADRPDERLRFERLHRLSVVINLLQLVASGVVCGWLMLR